MVTKKLCRGDFRSLRRMCSPNTQVVEQIKAKIGLPDLSTQAWTTYGPLQARSGITNASAIPQLVLDTHPLETPPIVDDYQQSALSDTTQRPAAAASCEHNSSAPVAMTSVDASLSHTEVLDPSRRLTNRTSGYTATTDRSSVSKTF
jgi:hypothetical protein